MTPDEALAWLYSTQQFGIKLGLENTQRLLAAVGSPERQMRCLHVAGTNGKGSVCAMLDAVLRRAGFRVGLTTSPHLVDFRERIQVDGEWISREALADGLTRLREVTADWEHLPTFFEFATVLAVRHFAEARVDFAVLETGMGGRLDATNAVTPVVSVITPISLDHQKWLGDTVAAIAGEKAGIIKAGVPVVSSAQTAEARAVLDAAAGALGLTVHFVAHGLGSDWEVGLAGGHQRENAALALAALDAAGIVVPESARRAGLAAVRWPGRFQIAGGWVLDGAHNEAGSAQLVRTWREMFGERKTRVIFGALKDKDYRAMLANVALIASEVVFVPVDSERGEDPRNFGAVAVAGCPVRVAGSLDAAMGDVAANAAVGESPIGLITGSLFLVGEALAAIERR